MSSLVRRIGAQGSMIVLLVAMSAIAASAQALQFRMYGTVSPPAGWVFMAGELTGDAHDDLFAYHPSDLT